MSEYRAGFVSFVGRPNVGKSTLVNALVGEKIAITSSKPQTTRRVIRGIRTEPNGQLIVVDTPGIHRPRTLLGERLNALVQTTLGDVDVIGFCVPASEAIGPGDRFICEQIAEHPRARTIAVVTKIDAASKAQIAHQLVAVDGLREWDAVIPVSAREDRQLDDLVAEVIRLLPPAPAALYPEGDITDESVSDRIAEHIREVILERMSDELPHSLAVTLDDIIPRDDSDIIDVYANIFVERDSQKAIVIGRGGAMLREIGSQVRPTIEQLLGSRVFLSLRVKVAKDWQRDSKQLGRLGF